MMLAGIRVLSFTHYLQGPSASQILGDLGADVLKIERPAGTYERRWSGMRMYVNGESLFFLLAGRNQRNLCVDIRVPEGKEIVWKLIREADVVMENYRPGVMDRLGFGYDAVAAVHPAVVYASFSGYGSDGPYRDKAGQDLLAQALSGLMTLSGRKGSPPTPVGTALVDQHGAVLGALGILAALLGRVRTGKGRRVESTLLNAALDLQIEPLVYFLNGARLYEKSETGISSRFHNAPYGVFETADGYLCLSLCPAKQLAEVFADPSFLEYSFEDQFEQREQINARVAAHLKQRTTEAWFALFEDHGVWYAPVNDYEAVARDPQVQHMGAIQVMQHPQAGDVKVLAHPVRYDGETLPIRTPPPPLGAHTREILEGLGYEPEAIRALEEKGVIRTNSGKDGGS